MFARKNGKENVAKNAIFPNFIQSPNIKYSTYAKTVCGELKGQGQVHMIVRSIEVSQGQVRVIARSIERLKGSSQEVSFEKNSAGSQ